MDLSTSDLNRLSLSVCGTNNANENSNKDNNPFAKLSSMNFNDKLEFNHKLYGNAYKNNVGK